MNFPWIKRPDLIFQAHDSGGWLIKDPLTLTYTLLDDAEFQILQLMDGTLTLPELLRRARRWVPDRHLTADDIGHFVQSLASNQLIRRSSAGDADRLKPASSSWLGQGFRLLLNILRIQIPLINPSKLIDRLLPSLSILFNPSFRTAMSFVMFSALLIVVTNFRHITEQIPSIDQFLGPANLALLLTAFVVVKLLHEAGHAVTARYYGAECSECGVMLMILTPVLYTNVTDGWRLPRRQRMEITAAGILVELTLASFATILWWLASPGLTSSLLLNIMLVCSVNTLLFNGNPLLRFDGYFLLSDWWRIPNLSSRASSSVRQAVVQLVTGCESDEREPHNLHWKILGYGLAAAVYRVFLSLAILQLIHHVARDAGFEIFGLIVSSVFLFGVVVLPTLRFAGDVAAASIRSETGGGRMRFFVLSAATVSLLIVPLPASTLAPATVESEGVPVYTQLSGQLTPLVDYGDTVIAGQRLAVLQNLGLQKTRSELVGRVNELAEQIEILTDSPMTADSSMLPTLQTARQAAEADLEAFNSELVQKTVASPAAGVLLPPAATPRKPGSDLPEFWHSVPLTTSNSNAWLQRGTLVGYVGDRDELLLSCCFSEADAAEIRVGQTTEFLPASGSEPFAATVVEVAGIPAKTVSHRFGVAGLLPGAPAEGGWDPADTIFLVTARLAIQPEDVVPALHTVGHVRIYTQSISLGRRILRYVRRTFS